MNQLSIFGDKKPVNWFLYIDGAARNNPGPAAAGMYLLKEQETVCKKGYYLGTKTNNQAEYAALIIGVSLAKEYMPPADKLNIKSDSLLLVRQIAGEYAIKNPELKKLHQQALMLLDNMNYSIVHVYREDNKIADSMANLALDKKIALPEKYAI